MGYAFISYVKENQDRVLNICDVLTNKGFDIWVDINDLLPGVQWRYTIRAAVAEADFFLAFFSKEYYTRDTTHMNEEITLAIDRMRKMHPNRIWFIPIRLSGSIPLWRIDAVQTLRDLQYADLENEWERDMERIFRWLRSRPC